MIFEAEEIPDMRIYICILVESDREYKVQWRGYGRRDATYVGARTAPTTIWGYELIAKYEAKQIAAGNKKITKGIATKRSVRTASISNLHVHHTAKTVALELTAYVLAPNSLVVT